MDSGKVWRVRASAKLIDASKEVYKDGCRAMLLVMVKETGDAGGPYELAVHSNGGEDFSPSQMSFIMHTLADSMVQNAYELKGDVH